MKYSYWSLVIILLFNGCSKEEPTPKNGIPVANAGVSQTVTAQTTVTLDGSESSDPDGDDLTYLWKIMAKPDESATTLSQPTVVNPTFTPDKAGEYEIQLIVNDGQVNSQPATVIITAEPVNLAPVANAGTNQNTITGTIITLDGSGSSDPDRDPLSYFWSIESRPANSTAKLSKIDTSHPKFTPDQDGEYIIALVVSDGKAESEPAKVRVMAAIGNVAPVARAKGDQSVTAGSTVNLDASTSSDANNDQLTYTWQIAIAPNGSNANLSDVNASHPTFIADLGGIYSIVLIVNDGTVNSEPDTLLVTVANVDTNAAPIADAGVDRDVHAGTTITLDGSFSYDPDSDPLTYTWHITSSPGGSSASLSNEFSVYPMITPDVEGTYVITLSVNDGTVESSPDAVTITATTFSFKEQLVNIGIDPADADYLITNHLADVQVVLNDQDRIFKDMPTLDNMFGLPTDPDTAPFVDPQMTYWSEQNKAKFKRMYGRFVFVVNSPKFIDAFNANIGLLDPNLREGDPPAIPYPANYEEFRAAANKAMIDGGYRYKFFISDRATYVAYGLQGLKLKVENVMFGAPTPGAVHNTEALILHELTHSWGYAHANLGIPSGPPPVDNIPYYIQGLVGSSYLDPGAPLVYDTPDALLTIYFGN